MRIAFGLEIFYPETNGVITSTINLANNLIDMGHEVYFFVPKDKNFTEDVIEKGIHIIHIKNLPSGIYRGLKLIPIWSWYLAPYFKKYKFDVIHNTGPWVIGLSTSHAARRFHVPVVATHHTLINDPTYIKYALKSEKLAYAATDAIWPVVMNPFYFLSWAITAPSKYTCEELRKRYPDHDVRYISNGIDISKFREDLPISPLPSSIPERFADQDTFLFVGRLGFEKALDTTIIAFAECKKKNKNAKLLIVGQGPAEEQIKEMIKDNDLTEDDIHLAGLVPNDIIIGSRLLNRTLCFVTASLTENQAMTVIEALCAGSTVICANVPNMTSLVDKSEGWYFEGGNASDLASKMDYVFNHRDEVEEKRKNCKHSKNKFDGKEVAKQFEALYKELAEKRKNGFYVKGGKRSAAKELKKLNAGS